MYSRYSMQKCLLFMLEKFKECVDSVEKVINHLSIVKACQKDDIPTKKIKMNKDIFAGFTAKDFNTCFDKGAFLDDFKTC